MSDFNWRRWAKTSLVLIAVFAFGVCGYSTIASAQQNLLINSDLSDGNGGEPVSWGHQSWRYGNDDTTPFQWRAAENPPELEVTNPDPDDARWTQPLHLQAGWYHFTAQVRTENVGQNDTGANLSLLEAWVLSHFVTGTSDWQPVGFYLKVGNAGADVTVACRLGFYSSTNIGKAYFRNLQAVAVSGPSTGGDPAYDWDKVYTGPSK